MRVVQSLKSCRSFKESTGFSRAVQALKYCSALAGEGTHPQTPAGAEAQKIKFPILPARLESVRFPKAKSASA